MLAFPFTSHLRSSAKLGNSITRCLKNVTRTNSSLSYCVNLVKKLDYENYLCSLLLPDNLKATAFAIRALNAEVSMVQARVTEEKIMPMRFQFWENCLNDIYNDKTVNHPVLIQLSNAIKRHKLSKMFLKKLITVRTKQLNRSTFKDMDEMQNYADQTNSPIYMLLLEASGIKDVNCDHVAAHLGTSQGISNLIRALPHNAQELLVMLPLSLLAKHNVSEESIFRGTVNQEKLEMIVYDIAIVAHDHLKVAKSMVEKVSPDLRTIFLPAVAVGSFLKRLEKHDFNVFHKSVQLRNIWLPIQLYYNKRMKQF